MYSNERKRFPKELFLPGFPTRDNLKPGTEDLFYILFKNHFTDPLNNPIINVPDPLHLAEHHQCGGK